jgi:hypothetical protein
VAANPAKMAGQEMPALQIPHPMIEVDQRQIRHFVLGTVPADQPAVSLGAKDNVSVQCH